MEAISELQLLLYKITVCLGNEWTYDPDAVGGEGDLVSNTGHRIRIFPKGKKKILFFPVYPTAKDGRRLESEFNGIGVSITRSADSICKDLNSRFFPKYYVEYERMLKKISGRNKEIKSMENEIGRLKKQYFNPKIKGIRSSGLCLYIDFCKNGTESRSNKYATIEIIGEDIYSIKLYASKNDLTEQLFKHISEKINSKPKNKLETEK